MRLADSLLALPLKLTATRAVLLLTAALGALVGWALLAPADDHAQTIQETRLLASDGDGGDRFGFSVSLWGNVAIVGACEDGPGDGANGYRSGSAYVYRFDGTDWVEQARLRASDGAREDLFGGSVSISGDRVAVGAWGDDDNGSLAGSAYIYRLQGLERSSATSKVAP